MTRCPSGISRLLVALASLLALAAAADDAVTRHGTLKGQILDHTAAADVKARSRRWLFAALVVVLFLLALLGLWVAL